MIEDAPIVKETRKVRCSISERFDNDPDRYIDYLLSLEDERQLKLKPGAECMEKDQSPVASSQC